MTKQIFPFYFLLQERAKPILPLSSPPPSLPRANLNPPNHPHPPPTHPPIPHKKWFKDLFHIYYIDMNMNFLALNDDVKFIIASHLQSDRKINKNFMNQPDDNLQKNLFNEVKEMSLDIEEVCIDLVNDNKKFDDEIEFF